MNHILLVSKDFHGNGQLSTGEWQEALLHYYSLASFLGCVLRLGRTKNVPWFLWAKLAADTGTAFFLIGKELSVLTETSHSSWRARLTFESHVWVVLNFVEPMVPFSAISKAKPSRDHSCGRCLCAAAAVADGARGADLTETG